MSRLAPWVLAVQMSLGATAGHADVVIDWN